MNTFKRIGLSVIAFTSLTIVSVARADGDGGNHKQCREAFKSCAASSGMPERRSGTKPTQEQRDAMKTCVEAKASALGITCEHPGGHHHGKRGDQAAQEGQGDINQ